MAVVVIVLLALLALLALVLGLLAAVAYVYSRGAPRGPRSDFDPNLNAVRSRAPEPSEFDDMQHRLLASLDEAIRLLERPTEECARDNQQLRQLSSRIYDDASGLRSIAAARSG